MQLNNLRIFSSMKAIKVTLIIISTIILATSCTIQRTAVGNYNEVQCDKKLLTKEKEVALFWELIPIRKVDKKIKVKNYEKVSKRGFFDTVVFYGTAGIISFHTVKIYVKECPNE